MMANLIDEISHVKGHDIQDVLNAVLQRYETFFPEWEVSTVSIEKCEDRNEQLDRMIQMLARMKTSSK